MDLVHGIGELEALVDTGTRVPGFRRKVLVDIDRLTELGSELRSSVPASIREAEEVLRQKESMLNQARLEAERVKTAAMDEASVVTTAANREHETKVGDTEIIKTAQTRGQQIENEAMAKAQQIVQDAKQNAYRLMKETDAVANGLREGADRYAREVLFSLEEQLASALGQVRAGIDSLSLEDVLVPSPQELEQVAS